MKKYFLLTISIALLSHQILLAQEFPKGFICYLKLHNGAVTNFKSSADIYVGGAQVVPEYTVIKHALRAGLVAGTFYTEKKLQASFGPTASVLLKQFTVGSFGSAANIHAHAEHLWSTGSHKLIGGGVAANFLNYITIGLTAHRDYHYNNWWLQTELGIRLSKPFKSKEL